MVSSALTPQTPIMAPLPDDGEVGFAERVVTDQLILGVRQRQQAFALGGGQD